MPKVAEVFHNDVRFRCQLAEELAPFIAFEIERQALLVPIKSEEVATLDFAFVVLEFRRGAGRAPA